MGKLFRNRIFVGDQVKMKSLGRAINQYVLNKGKLGAIHTYTHTYAHLHTRTHTCTHMHTYRVHAHTLAHTRARPHTRTHGGALVKMETEVGCSYKPRRAKSCCRGGRWGGPAGPSHIWAWDFANPRLLEHFTAALADGEIHADSEVESMTLLRGDVLTSAADHRLLNSNKCPSSPPLPSAEGPREAAASGQWAAQPGPARAFSLPTRRLLTFPRASDQGCQLHSHLRQLTASDANVRLSPPGFLWKDPAGAMRGFLSAPSPVDVRAEPRTPGDARPASRVHTEQPNEGTSVSGSLSGVQGATPAFQRRFS